MEQIESGSAGMMALFVIGLMAALFIWILVGGVFDQLRTTHNATVALDGFPTSDERVNTLNFLTTAMVVVPFLGILVPLTLYALIISVRKGSEGG